MCHILIRFSPSNEMLNFWMHLAFNLSEALNAKQSLVKHTPAEQRAALCTHVRRKISRWSLTSCLWSESGSGGDWTSDCGYFSLCCQRKRTKKKKRKKSGDAVSSFSCFGCHHHCRTSAYPCWRSVSWQNTHKSGVAPFDISQTTLRDSLLEYQWEPTYLFTPHVYKTQRFYYSDHCTISSFNDY